MYSLILFPALLVLIWVLMIQPQRRRRQQQAQMITQLTVGDDVITAGGLYGRVHELRDQDIMLEVAPETRLRVAKSAIAGLVETEQVERPAEPR